MKPYTVKVIEQKIPGTTRQRVVSSNGTELQRQNIYLKEEAWEALAKLSEEQRVSGSVVISRLIWDASIRNPAYSKPRSPRD